MPKLVGTTIGQYNIVEQLGRGGMSAVYKGYQPALKRYVAVKVLDPTISSDELFLARFQREAQAVALLRHPHIVQIYDFGNVDDMYYMVMEYVDGQSLRDRLKVSSAGGKFLPAQEVLGIVWAMASALDYAYQRGIVHRDIKPGNILLSADGQAVLSDFGIAQMVKSSRLTMSGLVGTPNYMSPEQGQGLEIDQRTDIYSLGIVTYEMLSNRVPFSNDTPFAVVMAHVTRPLPSLREIRPDLPQAVEDVIVKATAKDKEQRYYRAMEFAESLEAAFAPLLDSSAAADDELLSCARCHLPLEPGQRFCARCGAHVGLGVPPGVDGAKFPYLPEPVGVPAGISVIDDSGASPRAWRTPARAMRLPPPPEATNPALLPKREEPLKRSPGRVWLALSAALLLLVLALVLAVVFLWPLREGNEVVAAQPTATASTSMQETLQASALRTAAASTVPSILEPLRATPEVTAETALSAGTSPADSDPTPGPSRTAGVPTSSSAAPGTPSAALTRVLGPTPTPTAEILTGKIAFKTDRDGKESLYVMNADGSNPHPLTDLAAHAQAVDRESLSPDGKERLRVQDNSGNYDIYMVPADEHKAAMAITSHAAADYDPVWSPTDALIAFVSLRTDGKDAIFVMSPNGRDDRQLTFNAGALDKHPTWSPDGKQIAFSSDRDDGRRQIYVINLDGTGQTNISNNSFEDWEPVWFK